jgi:(4-(4-[2-(gamma-L-glutamylamino)ethyl]phenoxymethyl)furan-2-yl)methanamine synthase
MPPEAIIGWDLGGAHLKAARLDATGRVERVVQLPCALWRGLVELERALDAASALLGPAATHAVTMTGEMADLFATREEGVACLVAAMCARFGGLRFYAGESGFLPPARTAGAAAVLASANWMASAELVASCLPDALLVDVGSTTTDLVPIRGGRICARGRDDASRLEARELVYTGVARTPVMAMAADALFQGRAVPLVAELFATAADVHRLCGRLPRDADQHPAADAGEKTEAGSARRLARMIGRDVDTAPLDDWRGLVRALAAAQSHRIQEAGDQVIARESLPPEAPVVAAGVGRFLAADLAARLGRHCLDFARLLADPGPEPDRVSDCAPAVAVAWLSRAQGGGAHPPG